MFKSALAISGILSLAGAILVVSLIQVTHPRFVFSQNQIKNFAISPTPQATPTATPVDYYLPYPGILPDHFLWPLKALRDYLWVKFTLNPAQKAEKLLHLADKRIGASQALITGGQIDLGTSVATKAGKYLEQSLEQELLAQKQGAETDQLLDHIAKSALKQQEITNSLQSKVQGPSAASLDQATKYFRQAYDTAAQRLRDHNRPVPGQS